MPDVRTLPLRILQPEWADEVPAPPHDALSRADRRRHLAEHPNSYLGVTRSADDLDVDLMLVDPAQVAQEAIRLSRDSLEELLAEGAFGPDEGGRLLLYRLDDGEHRQTGLVCGVATADYDQGRVVVHERIDRGRADFLAHHLRSVGAHSSPIALAFRRADGLRAIIERVTATAKPVLEVVEPGLTQTLWELEDEADRAAALASVSAEALYIVDGHHRAAAASADRQRHPDLPGDPHLMLSVLFPFDQLRNQAFHRSIRPVDTADLLDRLGSTFPLRATASLDEVVDREPGTVAIAVGGPTTRWYLLDLPPAGSDGPDIDPTRLTQHVLGPLLHIDDSAADPRLVYQPGPGDLAAMSSLEPEPDQVVFWMRPVPPADLLNAADQGLVMPPKSTYFEPKVRAGLFVRLTDPTLP